VAALAGVPDAKVLAGGQSLVPLLSMRLAAPSLLVDINAVPGLDTIDVVDPRDAGSGVGGGAPGVTVGALARHADVLAHDGARRVQPLLGLALAHVAHATIRNRGTTVGSIVHADAAAEMPVVLRLLDGHVEVEGTSGRRTIAAGDLFLGPLESSLHHDEIAVAAFFPALAPRAGVAFDEVARRHGDYALCGVAALVRLDDAGTVVEARAGYVSVADVPAVVDVTAELARGVTDAALAAAGERALTAIDPVADIHATAAYRAQLVRVLTARVLRAAHDHAVARSATAGAPGSAAPTTSGDQ
jgi:carbon-monoxide dehydrogenase medium subunit